MAETALKPPALALEFIESLPKYRPPCCERAIAETADSRIAACLAACASPFTVEDDGTGEDIGEWLICDLCECCWRPGAQQKHYEGCAFLLLLDQAPEPRDEVDGG